jgi:hypothetical protein
MVTTQEQIVQQKYPEFLTDRQQQLLNTLFGVQQVGQEGDADYVAPVTGTLEAPMQIPGQEVAGFTPTQQAAFNLQNQGLGSYQPFLQAGQAGQTAALGTLGAGVQTIGGAQFEPTADRMSQFMDPYQKLVTNEALKEIDRQSAMAGQGLAAQANKVGAFGNERYALQESELQRNTQDLKSRRIFEDLSKNYQQAQAASQAANTQRIQAGSAFGQLGQATSGIGGQMAGLGSQLQQQQATDVSGLLGIGGLQQQLAQSSANTGYQNQLNAMMEPYRRLSFGSQTLQQLTPGIGTATQTVAPMPTSNPYLQAAGAIGSAGVGLGALMG